MPHLPDFVFCLAPTQVSAAAVEENCIAAPFGEAHVLLKNFRASDQQMLPVLVLLGGNLLSAWLS